MSYEHCERHDMDATNGCEICELEERLTESAESLRSEAKVIASYADSVKRAIDQAHHERRRSERESEGDKAAIKAVRVALCTAGHCGDGGPLDGLVTRALKEAATKAHTDVCVEVRLIAEIEHIVTRTYRELHQHDQEDDDLGTLPQRLERVILMAKRSGDPSEENRRKWAKIAQDLRDATVEFQAAFKGRL